MANKKTFKGNKGKYLIELSANPVQTSTEICEKLGISTSSYYLWIRDDEDFRARIESIRQSITDVIDEKLNNYANKLADKYIELAEQSADKRTQLEALEKIYNKLNRVHGNTKQQTITKFEIEFGE